MRSSRPKSSPPGTTPSEPPRADGVAGGWPAYRQEIRFLTFFVLILGGGFAFLSLNPVNDGVVEPFTAGVARVSGVALDLIGQEVEMQGTVIESDRFAVNIRNGCNGVETMIIFLAAILAFPSTWKSRLAGLVLGILAIQLVNLVRVVALFLTGVYFPEYFASSHTVVWQTLVILFGVLLWIFWANRFATPATAAAESE